MQLSIQTNFPEVQRKLDLLGKSANRALREAINRTAEWAETDVRREMIRVFDRPTPYTLKALRVFYATTAKPQAVLWFRQRSADRDKQWAVAQIQGGHRQLKPMELRLNRIGILPRGWMIVPGGGAPMDDFGNISPGEVSRILNVLGAYTEAGYNKANDKTRARLRKGSIKKNQYGFEYWVNPATTLKQPHLLPGVYKRFYTAWGTSLKPILIFVRGASYRKRLNFEAVVRSTMLRRFPAEFEKAMESLKATGSASSFRRTGR